MGYISLKHIGNQIDVGQNITFRVKYNKKGNDKPGGMAINFRQRMGEGNDIILHFNPIARHPSYQIVLNSFVNGIWQKEVSTGANPAVFSDEFTLSLDIKDTRTVLVRVQGGILTTYTCPVDITDTEFIGFSPDYRITEEN
ncbi:uncharacterized protein LOC133178792 [Saccostrea echinata]|uniref:uncharacterized protein LOC133178792 n=1 Tax=Saccostrea echinata TaxID=191078 RepID=UPI002A80FED4|nr:uncharacterized protein LOC133178792 [Saccostrea echinata]